MPLTTIYDGGARVIANSTAIQETLHPTVMAYVNIMRQVTGGNYIMNLNEINAVNNLVKGLVANGLWTKMQALYPMIGGTAAAHKFNLVDPRDADAAFRLSFIGTWTHSSTGAKPNGSNAYANTFYQPSVQATQNSHHLSYYSRTNSNATEVEIGSVTGFTSRSFLEIRTGGVTYGQINGNVTTFFQYSDPNALGFYCNNRTASALINGWKNGVKQTEATTLPSSTPNASNYFLGAYNNGGTPQVYSIKECALASIGTGLTDNEARAFYNLVQDYQTKLGRQV